MIKGGFASSPTFSDRGLFKAAFGKLAVQVGNAAEIIGSSGECTK
jgi:hypothetical protein